MNVTAASSYEPMQSAFVHCAFDSTVDSDHVSAGAEQLVDGDEDGGQQAVPFRS